MANINPNEFAYRNMLINLDKLITSRELSAMKFQCKSVVGIGDRNLARIETCLDLWSKLEERGHLRVNNLSLLKGLLESCTDNRRDVLDVVLNFEKGNHKNIVNGGDSRTSGSNGCQEDLRSEITFLEDNLGRDWKFFMRALGMEESKLEMCIESHPRNVKEQIHKAFTDYLTDVKKTDILKALKVLNRNDLLHKISSGLP